MKSPRRWNGRKGLLKAIKLSVELNDDESNFQFLFQFGQVSLREPKDGNDLGILLG